MSMYELTCKNCGHVFYTIKVQCGVKLNTEICPVCSNTNLDSVMIEKPDTEQWAEDGECTGCPVGGISQ